MTTRSHPRSGMLLDAPAADAARRAGRPLDLYLVVGNAHTRRASVIRCLTGCFNRSVRDIVRRRDDRAMKLYARVGALQETRTSPGAFVAEVQAVPCEAVLCCLAGSAPAGAAADYPDAAGYVEWFRQAGWRVRAIAVLGQNAGNLKSPALRHFPHAGTSPINLTAGDVRAFFDWR